MPRFENRMNIVAAASKQLLTGLDVVLELSRFVFAKKSHFERAGNRRAFSEFQWDEVSVRALALSDDGRGAGAFWKCSKDDRGNGRDLSE